MIIEYFKKTCLKTDISSELLHLSSHNPMAKVKIMHREDFNPFACAIGFGETKNASLLVGGVNEGDTLSAKLLMMLARTLCLATSQNNCLLGIDINEVFRKKGVWIIPRFSEMPNTSSALNLITEKLDPRFITQISTGEGSVQYFSSKRNEMNARLFAYLLAASCNYKTESKHNAENENSLCRWFCDETSRSAYSISVCEGNDIDSEYSEQLFGRISESLLICATS